MQAHRIPRAVRSPAMDFTEVGDGVDPVINLRVLNEYLLRRLPAIDTIRIVRALAKDSYDRTLNEQVEGFVSSLFL